MQYSPKKKPEKFNLVLFLMDSLIYFLLAAFIALMLPLFFGLILAGKSRGGPMRDAMDNYIVPMYSDWDNMKILENVSLIVALFLLFIILYRKLKKFHIYSFETDDSKLIVNSINILKQKKQKIVSISLIRLQFKKDTKESDLRYEIFLENNKRPYFNTDKSKYWDAKTDNIKLNDLFHELQKKGCKLTYNNMESGSGAEIITHLIQ